MSSDTAPKRPAPPGGSTASDYVPPDLDRGTSPAFTDVAPGTWRAIQAAAAATVPALAATRPGVSEPELVRACQGLCNALRAEIDGAPQLLPVPSAALPLRDVLDELRATYLAAPGDTDTPASAQAMLTVLRAFESIRERIARDSTQRFASAFAGADALDLVVEVAHDMRSPLASILFLVDRMRLGQSGPVTSLQERQLGLVYSAAFGLSSLVGDVMEIARGGERLVDRDSVPFSLSELMQGVYDILLPVAEEKQLSLTVTVPPSDSRLGHPQALSRVLLNLATNALKFTAVGGVTVTAEQRSRTQVEFSVLDTGRGIPSEVMSTLFDTFRVRQDNAFGRDLLFSSAGLGLSICRKLVALMDGELEVVTEVGKGTRFRFVLDLPPAGRL